MRKLMSLAAVTAGFVLASCVAGLAAPELIVKLSIPEEAGRARVQEPITMGVPLPEGKVTDVRRLALADAEGKLVFGARSDLDLGSDSLSVSLP